jgi:O-antigen/teichoic acid export membrane protein
MKTHSKMARLRTDHSEMAPILKTLAELATKYRGFLALCDQGVISVTNFVTAMLIGRSCGKAELGIYTLAWSILSLANGISATLIASPCTLLGPHFGRARRRRYFGSLAVHQIVLSMALAFVMSAAASLFARTGWFSNDISSGIRMIALVIIFTSLRDFVRTISFAQLRTAWALSIDVIASVIQLTGMFLLLRLRLLGVSPAFALLGVAAIVTSGIWVALNRESIRLDVRLFLPDLKRNWAFAKWLLGSAVAWQVATYFYPWMLAAFHGTSATGDWAACIAVVAAANPIFLGLNNYISPKIATVYATNGVTHMRRYVHRCCLTFAAILLPFVLTMAGAGRYLVARIYGNSFNAATIIIVILGLNMLVNAVTSPIAQGLFNLKCAKADMLVNVISVAFLFTLGVPIVKLYAASGAAVALLVSSSIVGLIKLALFRRKSHSVSVAPTVVAASLGPALAQPN